jgi:hypothetical protein
MEQQCDRAVAPRACSRRRWFATAGTGFVSATLAAASPAVAKEDPAELVAVTRADDARVAAFTAPTAENLDAIFSADLHYAHSTGAVDTKQSFIEVLTTGKTRYLAIDYATREFTFPTPGIALMTGQARIQTRSAAGANDNMLSFLAVWRLEEGRWRFLAWQSCRLPPPAPPP